MKVAIGLLNEINGLYNPCLDVDFVKERQVIMEVERLQGKFKLGDCVIYETKKGVHAVFHWNFVTYAEFLKILKDSPIVDKRFIQVVEKLGKANLRLRGKYAKQDIHPYWLVKSPFKPTKREKEVGNAVYTLTKKMIA